MTLHNVLGIRKCLICKHTNTMASWALELVNCIICSAECSRNAEVDRGRCSHNHLSRIISGLSRDERLRYIRIETDLITI